jgi:hypothetical protein
MKESQDRSCPCLTPSTNFLPGICIKAYAKPHIFRRLVIIAKFFRCVNNRLDENSQKFLLILPKSARDNLHYKKFVKPIAEIDAFVYNLH